MEKKKTVKISPRKMSIVAPAPSVYEKDFYKWIQQQSRLLKSKSLEKLDLENLIEEIESLGRSDKRALKSHFIILLQHLLKKEYQQRKETKSWDSSIRNSRMEIRLILEDSPSLKRELKSACEAAYVFAKEKASEETGIDIEKFPHECPWSLDEVLNS